MQPDIRNWWRSIVQGQVENDGVLLRLWNHGERLTTRPGSGAIIVTGRRAELAQLLVSRLALQYAEAEERGADRVKLQRNLAADTWRELKVIVGIVGEMPPIGEH